LYELIGVPSVAHKYPIVFRLALTECGIGNVEHHFRPYGENSGDALITAAALYKLAHAGPAIWHAPQRIAQGIFNNEGWIWGAREPD
jgi:hypothetical protein